MDFLDLHFENAPDIYWDQVDDNSEFLLAMGLQQSKIIVLFIDKFKNEPVEFNDDNHLSSDSIAECLNYILNLSFHIDKDYDCSNSKIFQSYFSSLLRLNELRLFQKKSKIESMIGKIFIDESIDSDIQITITCVDRLFKIEIYNNLLKSEVHSMQCRNLDETYKRIFSIINLFDYLHVGINYRSQSTHSTTFEKFIPYDNSTS